MPRESREVPFFPDAHINIWAGYQAGIIASAEVDANFCFQPSALPRSTSALLPYQMQAPPGPLLNGAATPSPPPLLLPPVRPPIRRRAPLGEVNANVQALGLELQDLERENARLRKENNCLKHKAAAQEVVVKAFCKYHVALAPPPSRA
jgi:hypothetical protein